jgi:hypothetical protein
MLNWIADPLTRSSVRHSLGWARLMPIIPAIVIEADRRSAGRPARIALIALCYAAPQAAAYLLEAEADGRLDQMRLAGQRPWELARRAAGGVGGIWLAVGVAALVWVITSGQATLNLLLGMGAIAGIPTTLAAFVSTAPLVRARIDPRIGVAALSVISIAVGVIGADVFRLTPPNEVFAAMLVVELAIIGWRVRRLPERLAHAPVARTASDWRLRPPPAEWLMNFPGFYRGLCLGATGVVLFAIFAPLPILIRLLRSDRVDETVLFFLPPLLIGLIAVSLICREDVVSGRLELVRQSAQRPARMVIEMVMGLWAPFVAASIGLALLVWPLFGLSTFGLSNIAFVVVLLAPLPLVEGWTRLWPMMLTVPFVLVLVTSRGTSSILPVFVAAIGWLAAIRSFADPGRPIFRPRMGVAITIIICATAVMSPNPLGPAFNARWAAGVLFLLSHVLIHPAVQDPMQRWGQPVAVFVTLLVGIGVQSSWADAGWTAPTAVAIWYGGYRLRQIDPDFPALQGALRIAVIVLATQLAISDTLRSLPWQVNNLSDPATALAASATAAAGMEIVYRIWLAIASRRRAAILPS